MRSLPLVALLLAGCTGSPATPVTAVAHLALADAAGRRLQQAVLPWTKADVDHVTLTLKLNSQPINSLTLTKGQLDKPVTLGNLVRNASYAVVARAYTLTNANIDNFGNVPESCTRSFQTGQESVINIGDLPLKLADKTFAGVTTPAGLEVNDGIVVDNTASNAIVIGP
jgi:hypothetical protein